MCIYSKPDYKGKGDVSILINLSLILITLELSSLQNIYKNYDNQRQPMPKGFEISSIV